MRESLTSPEAPRTMQRFEIVWHGRVLAQVSATDGAAAIKALIAEPGYGYLTAGVLTATPLELGWPAFDFDPDGGAQ